MVDFDRGTSFGIVCSVLWLRGQSPILDLNVNSFVGNRTLILRIMSTEKALPVHTNNTFEDLSGVATASFSNPYNALLEACDDDPVSVMGS